MDITVTGRKKAVTERFRRHLEDKLDKVPQIAPRVARAEVVLTHESNPRLAKTSERVEITCYVKRTVVRAEAAADEEYAALDLAMTKLLERLRRMNDRRRISHTGKHRLPSTGEAASALVMDVADADSDDGEGSTTEDAIDRALGTEGNSPIELREKVHTSEPMSVGQALTQMELVGHDFFLFHDADSDRASVVYRRRGWSYGLLRLDIDGDREDTAAQHATDGVSAASVGNAASTDGVGPAGPPAAASDDATHDEKLGVS